MTRRKKLLSVGAALLVIFGAGPAIYAYGFINGWHVRRMPPEELAALLEPGERILKPEGTGPFPAVLMFHGCGGLHEGDETWAKFFRDHGYVTLVVDSLSPRHIPLEDARVCGGRMLWGRERAGDVLMAVNRARHLEFVDPKRIFLVGWSHGGWAITDLLALDPPKDLPTNLTRAPCDLEGVAGAILFYPYLGFGALARGRTLHPHVPILMLLSGADQVVPTPASLEVAKRQRAAGIDVETHVYEGLNHCWDQTGMPDGGELRYDATATEDAKGRILSFLSKAGAPPLSSNAKSP